MADFIDFIRHGVLLGLDMDSTPVDVIHVLGTPYHIYDEPQHSTIYNYGAIEFIFGKKGIASLEIHINDNDCNLNIPGIEDFKDLSHETFLEVISELSLGYKKGKIIGNEFVLSFNKYGKATFKDNKLTTISIIDPENIY
ncbi:TPA: hypothetical protein N2G30_004547 [Salmonella enterica]|nr:hypothetical protein [Salmonella enterica]